LDTPSRLGISSKRGFQKSLATEGVLLWFDEASEAESKTKESSERAALLDGLEDPDLPGLLMGFVPEVPARARGEDDVVALGEELMWLFDGVLGGIKWPGTGE
jgi:hypothetical protein